MRIDQFIVLKHQARSRTQAQEWIKAGYVELYEGGRWRRVSKPSEVVDESTLYRIQLPDSEERFVSRAGKKLDGALEELKISVIGWRVLDVGQSTGGFTDCLLKRGAAEIIGVDVGKDQLSSDLRTDTRVGVLEGLNARYLSPDSLAPWPAAEAFDLVVMDVSFISISHIMPRLPVFLKPGGVLLSLVKPQFELGPECLDKRGIVKDNSLLEGLEDEIRLLCKTTGLEALNYIASPLKGKDGNQEYFVLARK